MRHFLIILMGLHLLIGFVLLRFGPLSEVLRDTEDDVRQQQAANGGLKASVSSMLVSKTIITVFVLLLWPCLWPTAVYRRDEITSRFATHPWYDDQDQTPLLH